MLQHLFTSLSSCADDDAESTGNERWRQLSSLLVVGELDRHRVHTMAFIGGLRLGETFTFKDMPQVTMACGASASKSDVAEKNAQAAQVISVLKRPVSTCDPTTGIRHSPNHAKHFLLPRRRQRRTPVIATSCSHLHDGRWLLEWRRKMLQMTFSATARHLRAHSYPASRNRYRTSQRAHYNQRVSRRTQLVCVLCGHTGSEADPSGHLVPSEVGRKTHPIQLNHTARLQLVT